MNSTLKHANHILAFHQIQKQKIPSIKVNGILRSQSSEKDTSDVNRANQFLDEHRPKQHIEARVSRGNVVYAYLTMDSRVYDIVSGDLVPPESLVDNDHAMLGIKVDPGKCWISDLGLYDLVKNLLENDNINRAEEAARKYWHSVVRYGNYRHNNTTSRPELLIVQDVSAEDIIEVIS